MSITTPVYLFSTPDTNNVPELFYTFYAPELSDVFRLQASQSTGFTTVRESTATFDATARIDQEVTFTSIGVLTDGVWYFRMRHERGATVSSWADTITKTIAGSTPALTSVVGYAISATSMKGEVTTDIAHGTLYAVASTSSTAPTKAQVKAGQMHTGSAAAASTSQAITTTGTKTVTLTGLTNGVTYYLHFMHEDAVSHQSTVVSSAAVISQDYPLSMYTCGYDGVYFNYSQLSTLNQARAGGGAAVAAHGDVVGRITDIFAGKAMAASADGRRGTLSVVGGKTGIHFDGTDDCYVGTAAWDFTGGVWAPEATLIVAYTAENSTATAEVLVESSTVLGSNQHAIGAFINDSYAGNVETGFRGGATDFYKSITVPNATASRIELLVVQFDQDAGSTNSMIIRKNKTTMAVNNGGTYSAGTNFGNLTWYHGARGDGSFRFKGIIAGWQIVNRLPTAGELTALEYFWNNTVND